MGLGIEIEGWGLELMIDIGDWDWGLEIWIGDWGLGIGIGDWL